MKMIVVLSPEPTGWLPVDRNMTAHAPHRFHVVPATSWYSPRDDPDILKSHQAPGA